MTLLYPFTSYADFVPFDFSLGRYLIDEDREVEVNFYYDLENYDSEDFLIKPFVKNGIVKIFNPDNGKWSDCYSLVSDLPFLQESMLIRIKGMRVKKSSLSFEIINVSSGDVYKTPEKEIWSKEVYSKYQENVNLNLQNTELLKEESLVEGSDEPEFVEVEKGNFLEEIEKIPKIYILVLGIILFIWSFILGFSANRNRKTLNIKNRTYSKW